MLLRVSRVSFKHWSTHALIVSLGMSRSGQKSPRTVLRGQDPRGGIEKLSVRKLSSAPSSPIFRFPRARDPSRRFHPRYSPRMIRSVATKLWQWRFRAKGKRSFAVANREIEDKQEEFCESKTTRRQCVLRFPIHCLNHDLGYFYRILSKDEGKVISIECARLFQSTLRDSNSHFAS